MGETCVNVVESSDLFNRRRTGGCEGPGLKL